MQWLNGKHVCFGKVLEVRTRPILRRLTMQGGHAHCQPPADTKRTHTDRAFVLRFFDRELKS
jgi:hypothetical protein